MHSHMFKSLSITNDMPTFIHKKKTPKTPTIHILLFTKQYNTFEAPKSGKKRTNQNVPSMTKINMGIFIRVIYVCAHQNLSSKMNIVVKSDANHPKCKKLIKTPITKIKLCNISTSSSLLSSITQNFHTYQQGEIVTTLSLFKWCTM